ncbi:MAG: NAD-glutamate dehydrogenase, partial [Gammaproteobacteria bacterium]
MKGIRHTDRLAAIAASADRSDLPIDAKPFVEAYYAQVAHEDLAGDPRMLAAAALDHLNFGRRRKPGTALVRAFNPTLERNGWTSPHTIVEMVNDDMPFLVDSSTMTLGLLGHGIHLTIHPRFTVERDGRGTLRSIAARRSGDEGLAESFIRIEISRQTDPDVLKRIETELAAALADERAAVEDWKPMLAQLRDASRQLAESRGSTPEIRREACAFLDWLADDHFTLLGYREYRLRRGASADTLVAVPGTGLGILRETER